MKIDATAIIAVAGLGLALYLVVQARQGVAAVATALNPADRNNLINRGVDAAVTAARGRDSTLGVWLYEMLHPNEFPWLE